MTIRPMTALLVALFGTLAIAADKEFVYAQKTGKLTLDGKEVGKGYSGHGDGKNNPDQEKVKDVGPIPAGLYKIGEPFKHEKAGAMTMRLTPDGHKAHDRTGLLIHGDNGKGDESASTGCVVLKPEYRKTIADSGITKLRVVKE